MSTIKPKPKVKAKAVPVEEVIDDYEEEVFFNKDSYNSFIKKNNIEMLGDDLYTYNDLHHIDIVAPNNYRITSEIMTEAEHTRVISERVKQIENGSPIFIDPGNETDPIRLAEKEIREKMSPIKIERYLSKTIKEIWDVNEMAIPFK